MLRSALSAEDYEEAKEYLTRASEMGWTDADLLLGQMYRDGSNGERNLDKCISYLTKAAENGNNKAMYMLGDLFYDGKYQKKDYEQAFRWYLMSASVGNARSQYQVGLMYTSGQGVEKDEDLAKQWFARYSSTMVNDSRKKAMDTLRARKGDIALSNDMLKAMSRSNQPPSMTTLALKYQSGKGFKKNEKAAMELMRKASVAGGSPRVKLAEMIESKNESEQFPQESLDLIRSAAEYGDAGAMYKMALLYKDGKGVEQNMDLYHRYMVMAAERGNKDAKDTVRQWKARTDRRQSEKKTKGNRPRNKEVKK